MEMSLWSVSAVGRHFSSIRNTARLAKKVMNSCVWFLFWGRLLKTSKGSQRTDMMQAWFFVGSLRNMPWNAWTGGPMSCDPRMPCLELSGSVSFSKSRCSEVIWMKSSISNVATGAHHWCKSEGPDWVRPRIWINGLGWGESKIQSDHLELFFFLGGGELHLSQTDTNVSPYLSPELKWKVDQSSVGDLKHNLMNVNSNISSTEFNGFHDCNLSINHVNPHPG